MIDIDRNKFTYTVQGTTYTPPGHGAFIARNNDGGFYFISYYDGTVGYNPVVVFETTLGTGADRLYQHDPYGTRTLITPSDIPGNLDDYVPKIIGANVFTADEDEQLIAVGFFQHPYPGLDQSHRLGLNPESHSLFESEFFGRATGHPREQCQAGQLEPDQCWVALHRLG